jgi:hypothetical protein
MDARDYIDGKLIKVSYENIDTSRNWEADTMKQ